MGYALLQFALSLALNCTVVWSMTQIMDMRSNRTFLLVSYACVVAYMLMVDLGAPALVYMPFGMLTYGFGLPIAFSRGPISHRLVRTTTVNLSAIAGNMPSIALYQLLTGKPMPAAHADMSAPLIWTTYGSAAVMTGLLLFSIITICRRADHARDFSIGLPVIAFSVWSCVLCTIMTIWCNVSNTPGAEYIVAMLAFCLTSLVLGLAAIMLASNEARSHRARANQAAELRQVKHIRSEIEHTAKHALQLRRLRHDIANQVDVVLELAQAGHVDDADRYLAKLQEEAHAIANAE